MSNHIIINDNDNNDNDNDTNSNKSPCGVKGKPSHIT